MMRPVRANGSLGSEAFLGKGVQESAQFALLGVRERRTGIHFSKYRAAPSSEPVNLVNGSASHVHACGGFARDAQRAHGSHEGDLSRKFCAPAPRDFRSHPIEELLDGGDRSLRNRTSVLRREMFGERERGRSPTCGGMQSARDGLGHGALLVGMRRTAKSIRRHQRAKQDIYSCFTGTPIGATLGAAIHIFL